MYSLETRFKNYIEQVPDSYRVSSLLFILRDCTFVHLNPDTNYILDMVFKGKPKQRAKYMPLLVEEYVKADLRADTQSGYIIGEHMFWKAARILATNSIGKKASKYVVFAAYDREDLGYVFTSILFSEIAYKYGGKWNVTTGEPISYFILRDILERFEQTLISTVGPVAYEFFHERP